MASGQQRSRGGAALGVEVASLPKSCRGPARRRPRSACRTRNGVETNQRLQPVRAVDHVPSGRTATLIGQVLLLASRRPRRGPSSVTSQGSGSRLAIAVLGPRPGRRGRRTGSRWRSSPPLASASRARLEPLLAPVVPWPVDDEVLLAALAAEAQRQQALVAVARDADLVAAWSDVPGGLGSRDT